MLPPLSDEFSFRKYGAIGLSFGTKTKIPDYKSLKTPRVIPLGIYF